MKFNLQIKFAPQATLQGVVRLQNGEKITELQTKPAGRSTRQSVGQKFSVNVLPNDAVYLRYDINKSETAPAFLPLVIEGTVGQQKMPPIRLTVPKFWKQVTIYLTGFTTTDADPRLIPSILDKAAELPFLVTNFFLNKQANTQRLNPGPARGDVLIDSPHATAYAAPRYLPQDESRDTEGGVVSEVPNAYPVWYATNRQATVNKQGSIIGFSAAQAKEVSYGVCHVHIPRGHRLGHVSPTLWRRLMYVILRQKDDETVYLQHLESLQQRAYWTAIRLQARKWSRSERCGLLYLHGFNVTFEHAAIRAAQIGYDLKVKGPVSFFSWPSRGSVMKYLTDELAIQSSEEHIAQYLLDFAQRSGLDRVHVVAHSMGNIGLLRSIDHIMKRVTANAPKLFTHFILAAPDVDYQTFLNLASNYSQVAKHTTLYVSNKDLALATAQKIRARSLAGLTPPVLVMPNIDTIQVGDVDLSRLGHGYVATARPVLTDISELITFDAPPRQRSFLHPTREGANTYWKITP